MAVSTGAEIAVADTTRFAPSPAGTTVTETFVLSLVVGRESSVSGTIWVPTRRTLLVSLTFVPITSAGWPGGCSRMMVSTMPVILSGMGILAVSYTHLRAHE